MAPRSSPSTIEITISSSDSTIATARCEDENLYSAMVIRQKTINLLHQGRVTLRTKERLKDGSYVTVDVQKHHTGGKTRPGLRLWAPCWAWVVVCRAADEFGISLSAKRGRWPKKFWSTAVRTLRELGNDRKARIAFLALTALCPTSKSNELAMAVDMAAKALRGE